MADLLLGGDAGHGYNTPGKRTPDGEREWSFNDTVIKAFIKEINTYQNVKFKRYDDPTGKTDVSLATRTNSANKDKVAYYFSFHHNANTGKWGTWTGSETHVYEKLSDSSETVKVARLLNAAQVSGMGLRDRGIKKTNLHITRETNMPAFLFEGGFMDSTIDIKKMRDKATLEKTGKAIAVAFAKYKGLKKKATSSAPKQEAPKANAKSDLTRVIVDGKQVGAFGKDAKVMEAVEKALKQGKKSIKIEEV